jgi:hypothetical protein
MQFEFMEEGGEQLHNDHLKPSRYQQVFWSAMLVTGGVPIVSDDP